MSEHLGVYRSLMGKLVVQVGAHARKGICLYYTSKYRCKWVQRIPLEFTLMALNGAEILQRALSNEYKSLGDADIAYLKAALTPATEAATPVARLRFDATKLITRISKDVKKRGSAAERFLMYREGMTAGEYIDLGGRRADLVYDAAHGFITLV